MKKLCLLVPMVLIATGLLMAQSTITPTGPYPNTFTSPGLTAHIPKNLSGAGDILGAHNGYGRGCVMCHAPHSGAFGNGVATSGDPQNGMYALWGEDLTPLYNRTFSFSGDGNTTKYPITLPANLQGAGNTIPPGQMNGLAPGGAKGPGGHSWYGETIVLFCLSCHDGVVTHVGVMNGTTVETLPIVGGTAPTLLALAAPSGGTPYSNDHPVGPNAQVSCGAPYNWDCTATSTTAIISNLGTNQQAFMNDYKGSFWNSGSNPLSTFYANPTEPNGVTCTTCHDQHSMTVYTNNNGSFATMFFINGQYTPNAGGNSVAQFCRNCHGGESNEMNGVSGVPTT